MGTELAASLGERKGAAGWVGVERLPQSRQGMAKSHSVVVDGGSVRLSLSSRDSSPSSLEASVGEDGGRR